MFNRKKLKEYMKKQGITQSQMARELGVSESAVRHIATGLKQPSLAMTIEFAEMMGCAIDDLVIKCKG